MAIGKPNGRLSFLKWTDRVSVTDRVSADVGVGVFISKVKS